MLATVKKVYQYGIYTSSFIVKHRIALWYFAWYWRNKQQQYISPRVHSDYRFLTCTWSLCTTSNHQSCITHAQKIRAGSIEIFGVATQGQGSLPWHTDICLQHVRPEADVQFVSQQFFKDITINSGTDTIAKDIKVPWELARFQWLPVLAHAYQLTGDETYAKAIIQHINDWISVNPFLRGIHWMNPMEAGLRAINWLIALSMIKESVQTTDLVMRSFSASLYEHYIFIEGNLEWYDGKTSNHYLSDLVGYLYLSWFFGDTKKMHWTLDELEREMCKQILPDGMSYEGSTRYHRLVTELFYYAYLLCEQEGLLVSDFYKITLQRMQEAMWWCTPHGGELIAVGDDDSGVVTALYSESIGNDELGDFNVDSRSSLRPTFAKASPRQWHMSCIQHSSKSDAEWQSSSKKNILENQFHYLRHFGLSIYKTEKLHVTLRHHAYNSRQPSGHFHNDVGSITLSIKGIPVIVDPGSYVYTASRTWRNQFRSAAVHNSSFPLDIEPVPLTDSLFFLAMQERVNVDDLFCARQEQYQKRGLLFERRMICDDASVIMQDIWQTMATQHFLFCWNFTLHPEIDVCINNGYVQFLHHRRLLATMRSEELSFCIEEGYYAPSYGIVQKTMCMRAYLPSATTTVTMRFAY